MLRPPLPLQTSFASSARRVCDACQRRRFTSLSTPTTRPSSTFVPGERTFSSSPLARRKGGPVRLFPEFDWRKPFKGQPVPSVYVAETEEEADELLGALTSMRLSVDLEPGERSQASRFNLRAVSNTSRRNYHASSTSEGVFTVADGEGIIVLQTAKMKYAPQKLLDIMDDPHIEKQTFGGVFAIGEFLFAPNFFRHTRPSNVLCLRQLAAKTYPALDKDATRALPNMLFAAKLAEEMGMHFPNVSGEPDFHIHKLQGPLLHRILNQSWFTHCAGHEIRSTFHKRTAKLLSAQPGLANQKHMFEEATEEMIRKFSYETDEVEEAFRRNGRL